jgi:peptidoglycan hydrolase-like protein with peptidoglycan-binding domain
MISDIVVFNKVNDPNSIFPFVFTDISPQVTSMSVSLSMDAVSQLSITVSDPDLYYLRSNVFQIRGLIAWQNMNFEIAVIEASQAAGKEQVKIQCRSAPCQELKRDKGRKLFTGGNPTSYVGFKAREKGMKFFGENTPPKENISQTSSGESDESVWQVMTSLAGSSNYVLFETDNRLFFTSQQFLLGKFAVTGRGANPGFLYTPIRYFSEQENAVRFDPIPQPLGRPVLNFGDGADGSNIRWYVIYVQRVLRERANQNLGVPDGVYGTSTAIAVANLQAFLGIPVNPTFIDFQTWAWIDFLANLEYRNAGSYSMRALECPTARKSDDNENAAEVSFQLPWDEGRLLRPGMTIRLEDMPSIFQTNYLVSEVSWEEGTFESVSVAARTPQEPSKEETKQDLNSRISFTGGGFTNTAA